MTADILRESLKRSPFVPFAIHLNDGRMVEVKNRDFCLLPPGWRTTAIVCYPDERFEFVYIRNVTTVAGAGEIPASPPGRQADERDP